MNAVERIVHYTKDEFIEQEAAYEVPATKPPPEWPTGGSLQFRDVVMKYRPSLPPVLHGISLNVRDGEKIGVGKWHPTTDKMFLGAYAVVLQSVEQVLARLVSLTFIRRMHSDEVCFCSRR